ncbi:MULTISPECIES: DUF418 domain-containing protein [unclassified Polaribacter]|uniref:DUF418 domain-containing protein n=1 Tax=unclassified Polaribacter TaxID=196858 RepID=UPI0011BE9BF1|nr:MULTISPECIES: DUF418 domain-containing protein [unclassified Polaribacter]TXD51809.1 DUF418 domain-containing protein [Polaribacter sp. IC063]TXD59171.1 DUF418 domain-containing protein [Polaribacter sp. IC066]
MKRIEEIDALRGFALFGIIMTHMFEGYLASLTPPQYTGFNILLPIDTFSKTVIQNLFVGKFYAIFSMLFGLSFYLILDKKNEASPLKFAWRLVLLFLIGCIHHIHYRGDFLTVYAVFGLALILFRKVPTKFILIIGLFFAFNIPTVLIKTIALIQPPVLESLQISTSPNPVEMAISYYDLILNGEYKKLLVSNSTTGFLNKYNYLKFSGRLWVIPGLFLLGLWIGRKKWHENLDEIPLAKLIGASFLIGTLSLLLNYSLSTPSNSEVAKYIGSIAKDASNIFIPILYIGLVLLCYKAKLTKNIVKQLIPVGKMGLTTYVLQSFFGIFIFYGYGLGLLLKLSGTGALGLGMLFFLIQIVFSKWWFSNFKFGPLEWLWRNATNRSWQSIRIRNPNSNKTELPIE